MPPKRPNPFSRRPPPRRLPTPSFDALVVVAVAVAVLVVVLLPPFRLSRIEIEGTNRLNPAYVAERARALLSTRWLGFLPRGSFFLTREQAFANDLHNDLARVVPMATITADKRFPHTLRILITEKSPAAILVANDQRALLDERGVVAGPVAEDESAVPVLTEANGLSFAPGDEAVAPSVLAALRPILQSFADRGLALAAFQTPKIQCPLAPQPPPSPATPSAAVTNSNSSAGQEPAGNTNASSNTGQNTNAVSLTPAQTAPCDDRAELRRTTVVEALTDEGWVAVFETKTGVTEALTALWIALDEKITDRSSLTSLDLRFLPRVYYR